MTQDQRERLRLITVGACAGSMLTLGIKHTLSFGESRWSWASLGLLVVIAIICVVSSVRGAPRQ